MRLIISLLLLVTVFMSCSDDSSDYVDPNQMENPQDDDPQGSTNQDIINSFLNIDLSNPQNYANQELPNYINKDNTNGNAITDQGATLGRVLFYDTNLSTNNTISCSSCHQQAFAFSDRDITSTGVNGQTTRHSMRLVNSRFAVESRFFWDERANTLEEQTTMPIQDHAEMGFSGINGAPDLNDLIANLQALDYYPILFNEAFGDVTITEDRMQRALAQFIRSIQSFDSKYDTGLSSVNNQNQPFPNFTQEENQGKLLFTTNFQSETDVVNGQTVSRRTNGGVNCMVCHGAPEFDINSNSLNNGMIGIINDTGTDEIVTRAPSLRDLINPQGQLNGGVFHTGIGTDLTAITDHYNLIPEDANNANLDNRLRPGGNPQFLDLTADEISQLTAFLSTLTGSDVYTNEKWSNPFN